MIYTVTLTPALDKTVVIPDFSVDHVNRIQTVRLDPGGKGINVSKALKALGMESVATGILGGGTGRFILDRLDEMRITHDFVTVPEETRTNLKVIDDVRNTHTDINEPGAPADPAVLDRVLSGLLASVRPGDRVVLAGKAPAGAADTLFGEWILALKARGALPYLDADASLLVHGAAACPEMIKPNDEELGRVTGRSFENIDEIASAARALGEGGVHTVAVSLGADGALFYRDGILLRGAGLHVPVGSTVGAGDAMMAAFCYGDERGLSFEETCRLALAVSAAAVMQSGTQPPQRAEIDALLPKVTLERI